jgi:TolA-binding protein
VKRARARRRFWLATAGAFALLTACAYFNTLYNANQIYDEAQKSEQRSVASQPGAAAPTPAPGSTSPQARQYEQVLEKCKSMIANYPKSKHVDDAMLLSAKALYALGRYDEAVAALDTLETRFPKSNLREEADFIKGEALYSAEKYDLAAVVLRDFVKQHRKNKNRPEALYLLCSSLMELGMNDEAVTTLQILEKDHSRSQYRFEAQVSMADILARKEFYQESLEVYERLNQSRIPESYRYDVWLGMATVQEQVKDYAGALTTLEDIETLPRSVEKEPRAILLRARAHASLDSTDLAIAEYRDVATRFARGVYAADAYYHLGSLYEAMDSLQTAQTNYQEVARAYSGSEYADEAIKRSGDIARILKVQEMTGDNSPEAEAMRAFSMAEIQLFQFSNPQKAIPNYQKVVTDYPDSEYGARAVYALGYINGVMLGDSVKAREWYEVLVANYPGSAQAQLAYGFYQGAPPPPPMSEWAQKKPPTQPAATPPPAGRRPPQRPGQQPPAGVDSTGVNRPLPADTTRTPPPAQQPAPADTSAAPADSSRGGG